MSLYQVGAIWYVDVASPNGGRVRRTSGTADKKAAQEFHDRLKAQFWRNKQFGDPIPSTWGEATVIWLQESQRGESDRYRIRALKLPLDLPLDQITGERIESELAGKTPGSFNRYANLILAVLNLARAKGKIAAVPAIPKKPETKGRTRWLTADEWQRLRKKLPGYLEEMARFTLATGLRMRNVLDLEWAQVDLRRKVAWIYADQAKARKPIGVPLNEDALAVLREREGKHKTWVFAHPDSGKPLYKASNRAWRDARKAAKLDGLRWHDLRHTWASWAVMSGVRLDELREMGGWATHSMVQRYAHLSPEHLATAAAKVKPVNLRHTNAIPKKKHA